MASAAPGPDAPDKTVGDGDGEDEDEDENGTHAAGSGDGPPPDTGLEGREDDEPSTALGRIVEWWRTRHQGTTPEERRRVIDTMFTTGGGTKTGRFWALQALAMVIATMGMSANSAAVVIGAMLVAPLMIPIMAVATSLALGWPQRAIVPLIGVAAASAGSVVLAFAMHSLVAAPTVTEEILARTSPDLRDLFIALAAGAAGALGTAREDVSASLPGVAVAVALVPPLAAIGMCLEMGEIDLASGAFLLFATNLVAIVLAGILVLLWFGFVPARLLERGRVAVWGGATATLAALVVVGVPLTIRTVEAAEIAENNRAVTEAVIGWLDDQPQMELTDLSVSETRVRVEVSGPSEPVEVAGLSRRIQSILSDEARTTVRWSVGSTAGGDEDSGERELVDRRSAIAAAARQVSGDEVEVEAVRFGEADDGSTYEVVLDLAGEDPPEDPEALVLAVLEATAGLDGFVDDPEIVIRFTERRVLPTASLTAE